VIALFEILLRRQFSHKALGPGVPNPPTATHKYFNSGFRHRLRQDVAVRSIAVLGAATLCFWWVSPSMAAPVGASSLDRFESSGIAPVQWLAADGRDPSFAQYALQTRDAIARHRWFPADASDERRRLEVDLVSPHQWDPAPGCEPTGTEGILLIHGLSDSPYLLRDLGTALAAQGSCRLIRSILVPGHATRPGDLLHVKYTDWIAAVQYGIRSFVGGAREVHLIGYSTGGALAVLAASDRQAPRPLPVRSLILISPAIRARGLPSGLVITPRVMSGVSATTGAFRWLERHEDLDFAKYESFPLNAWFQLVLLDERVAAATRSTLGVPLLGYVSWDDATTDAAASPPMNAAVSPLPPVTPRCRRSPNSRPTRASACAALPWPSGASSATRTFLSAFRKRTRTMASREIMRTASGTPSRAAGDRPSTATVSPLRCTIPRAPTTNLRVATRCAMAKRIRPISVSMCCADSRSIRASTPTCGPLAILSTKPHTANE
jgi:alpha-beta hydrolase superfamily lysophospholipase